MPHLTDEMRISDETPESIRARLLADTNAGIDPNDPAYADTQPGSFWDDLNRANALEFDRAYDRDNEVVAAAIPATSMGPFLDAWAISLGLERKDAAAAAGDVVFTGPNGTSIPAGAQVSTAQASPDTVPVTFTTDVGGTIGVSGTITLATTASDTGSAGNVPANTVTILDTPIAGVTVTNPHAMTGGADVETDEALEVRVSRKLSGAGGGGNVDDYVNWGLNHPGVGFVTVQPNTPTIGHVTVVVTDINNDPLPTSIVAGLQAVLDPSGAPAQGAGLAPVGATVHVSTPTTLPVAVVAEVTLEAGYSLDGEGGTHAVRADITDSIARYVNTLPSGADLLYNKVLAAVVDVLGVKNLASLSLNGGAAGADVIVGPTQGASLATPITLTAS